MSDDKGTPLRDPLDIPGGPGARMWTYVVIPYTSTYTPQHLADFLESLDIKGWEFVAPVGVTLVFRRRFTPPPPAPGTIQ